MSSLLGNLWVWHVPMPKLPEKHQFFDLSDYGRPMGILIAESLKHSTYSPIHITLGFVVSGLIAVGFILYEYYWAALFFLLLKSILDAADGELARIKNTPSYTGRYLDSISDFVLNLLTILAIWHITDNSFFYAIMAFIGLELQGTLYNYYYSILRNRYQGDTTSQVFETKTPMAFKNEEQRTVNMLHHIYTLCYGPYDRIIYSLDKNANTEDRLPNWLMTAVSCFGLGFQLLLIGFFLVLDIKELIIPYFILNTLMIFVFIAIRQMLNR